MCTFKCEFQILVYKIGQRKFLNQSQKILNRSKARLSGF